MGGPIRADSPCRDRFDLFAPVSGGQACSWSTADHPSCSTRRKGEAPGSLGRTRLPLARTARYPGGCASERRGPLPARQRVLWAGLGTTWGRMPHDLGSTGGRPWGCRGEASSRAACDVGILRPRPVEGIPLTYRPSRTRAAPTSSRTDESVSEGSAAQGHQRRSKDSDERCSTPPATASARNCTSR